MGGTIRAFILIAILISQGTALAASRMNDFAYGLRLTAPEKDGLAGVVVPDVVYRHLTQADGGDIRIFRMDGRLVPHLLGRPRPADASIAIKDLPFFPLHNETPGTGSTDVRVRTDASGAVLSISGAPATGGTGPPPAYLIDSSGLPQGLANLVLDWRRERPNVLIKARLETSRDLIRWHPLLPSVTLSDIRHGEQRLVNRTIMLPSGREQGRYLKLSLLSGADAVTLETVKGVPSPRDQLPPLQWLRAVYRSDQEASGSMQFDSGGRFPVDRIDLQFSQTNSLVIGTLQSRDSDRAVWRVHHQGVFYHLQMEDETLRSDPVSVPTTSDRYWKLDIDKRQSSLGNSVPRLMLGWRPQKVFFEAQRGGAYILAYGNRTAPDLPPPPELQEALAAAGGTVSLVDVGPAVDLGGPSRVQEPSRRASGRMVSLSTLLMGCVLLLAFLAWWAVRRLLKIDSPSHR